MRHAFMQEVPLPEHVVHPHRKSLLDWLQDGGTASWVILFLALLLFFLFVTLLVGRRSISSIVAHFAAALLPLMAGLWGVAGGAMEAFQELAITGGAADTANVSDALGHILVSFYLGTAVSFFGLVGTMILALMGPSKVPSPPPAPQ